MCGRVFQVYTAEMLRNRYLPDEPEAGPNLEPIFNLCPTMDSPVVLVDGNRQIARMRWQLVPANEPVFATELSTINARSESLFESRLYREIVVRQRCIVPISGFFEWKREGERKRPFKIHLRDVAQVNLEGPFSLPFPLPFKETTDRNDASLTDDDLPIESALEERFAARVDGRELCGKHRLVGRHELPSHASDLSVAVDQHDRGVHRGAEIENGLKVRTSFRFVGQVPIPEHFCRVDLEDSAAHRGRNVSGATASGTRSLHVRKSIE